MLIPTLLLFGGVLLLLSLADRKVRRLPLSPAVIYLLVGVIAGALLDAPDARALMGQATPIVIATETAVLISLLAVGLRLRVPPTLRAWREALLMAGPGMLVTIVLGALAAVLLLGLPWPAALLLGAIMAPTDPVLASEVQIRHDEDRDAVRLSLTAEGGLNDGRALPAVMLALGLLGLHDLLWTIGGGALVGVALGLLLGRLLQWRLAAGDKLARDELLFAGAVAFAFGVAKATATSTFVVMFAVGVTLLLPLRGAAVADGAQALSRRLGEFGERIERLIEAATVLAVGFALNSVIPTGPMLAFAAALLLIVRPLSVLAVVRRRTMARHPRRLVAWFGIRGIGTLYYLAFAIEQGADGPLGHTLIGAALAAIALSILAHGVSATPLMEAYQRRRRKLPTGPADHRPPVP